MIKNIRTRFIVWCRKHISIRYFVFAVSVLVGIIAAFLAVFLKVGVHFIEHNIVPNLNVSYSVIFPFIGLMITILLSRMLYKESMSHAITDILYSIARNSAFIRKSKIYSQLITSMFTVGFGGSVGLESPIVMAGSAMGSNVGRTLFMTYKQRTLLIGCGTAAVISAIFNAPIAGLIFSIEVILVDITLSSFTPLLLASVSATIMSSILQQNAVLFSLPHATAFVARDMPMYIALAVLCGILSRVFIAVLHNIENKI